MVKSFNVQHIMEMNSVILSFRDLPIYNVEREKEKERLRQTGRQADR